MATLGFDIPTKLAVVQLPDTSITVQEIVDQFRDFEDYLYAMSLDGAFGTGLLAAEGKGPAGGGDFGVITVSLLNGWRLQFADRPGPTVIECNVTSGNLIAYLDEPGSTTQIPVAPSTFVFATYAQATTGALLNVADLERLRQWMTNANRLLEGSVDNFELYADGEHWSTDAPIEVQAITDKSGNAIVLPDGAPAQRSEAAPP